MYNFEELDQITRNYMLTEFNKEQDGLPYLSKRMTAVGHGVFADLMRDAILDGNEVTLAAALGAPEYWVHATPRIAGGQVRVNTRAAAEALACTEFNTWYVRGFTRRLLDEGVTDCEVYRAAFAYQPRLECLQYEGRLLPVQALYDGHRAKYWPEPGIPRAVSMPVGPNCHHSIRRPR